jgi:hypothetical protein
MTRITLAVPGDYRMTVVHHPDGTMVVTIEPVESISPRLLEAIAELKAQRSVIDDAIMDMRRASLNEDLRG